MKRGLARNCAPVSKDNSQPYARTGCLVLNEDDLQGALDKPKTLDTLANAP
ncbi:MAG: hypothetical protein HYR71_04240 [Chloroflexi bacterium]|nr:hypothetical protein [Chloroflexota bacterium]